MEFKVGNQNVEYISVFRYLGVHVNERLDYSCTADTLSKAGGRALGSVFSKIQNYREVGYKTYSKLYHSCVVSVIDYCSGIWGFKQFDKIDMVQNMGYGVSNSLIKLIWYKIEQLGILWELLILAFTGNMGWITSTHRHLVNMLTAFTGNMGWITSTHRHLVNMLTLVLLNPDKPCLCKQCNLDQLASSEAN